MTDREKVIEGLEMSFRYSNVDESNTLVPQQLVLDALALLKAQEPRVMTSEEAASSKFGYLENDMYTYMPVFIYPGWGGLKHNVHMRAYVGCEALDMPITEYGKTWRCWTSRPTDEQREKVKWE